MSAIILRADPKRARVSIRYHTNESELWEVTVRPVDDETIFGVALDADAERAVDRAMDRAAKAAVPGIYPDGAEFPHPQDPSSGSGKVTP